MQAHSVFTLPGDAPGRISWSQSSSGFQPCLSRAVCDTCIVFLQAMFRTHIPLARPGPIRKEQRGTAILQDGA
eukprot:9917969-Alexandrium_andersonii.AAC.1